MSEWSKLKARVAGKWQVPLFLFSLLLLAGAFIRVQPNPARQPIADALQSLDRMLDAGFVDRALDLAELLQARDDAAKDEQAQIQLRLARAQFASAELHGIKTVGLGRRVVGAFAAAAEGGQTLTAEDYERLGQAHEWQGRIPSALQNYAEAIDRDIADPSDLRQRMILLSQGRPDRSAADINQKLDAMLADLEPHRLDLRIWAIEEKIHVLDEIDRLDEASTLLVRNREIFADSDFRNQFDYLEGLFLYKTGEFDQATKVLRTVRNRLDRLDEVHAMTGWLLGRTVLFDGGPKNPAEALAFFTDVISFHPGSVYAVASRVGQAEALAMLERHDEALEAYRVAMESLGQVGAQRLISRDVLRTSLGVMAQTLSQDGRFRPASEYARLATVLVDREDAEQATFYYQQLAQIQSLLGDHLRKDADDGDEVDADEVPTSRHDARDAYVAAAEAFQELAQINLLNEQLSADYSWRAAEAYGEAGRREDAVGLYAAFVKERPAHSLVPRALLRIGRHLQALGSLPAAIEAYRECYRRFPRTIDGSRALVPLARCYLALGPDNEELAEKTLNVVLRDSEVFTPDAPEFVDALFLLGDVLNRRGHHERAIATLDEALERYPDDERDWRTRYLLADSYRQSALALKSEMSEAAFGSELRQMQTAAYNRFDQARRLYRELLNEFDLRGLGNLAELERMYHRHAFLYEADCFFETRNYRDALKHYEEATHAFRDSPAGLAAYVQIINCYTFLGEPEEARAALARALIVVDAIPDGAFAASVSPESRRDWKRYLEWLGASRLF